MSLRNRARRLQHAAGLSYQQALTALRALGEAPARLARTWRWPLARCDAFLIDRALDPEFGPLREPEQRTCVRCEAAFFVERLDTPRACAACRVREASASATASGFAARVRAAWAMNEPRVPELADACRKLRMCTSAREVLVVDHAMRVLALDADPAQEVSGLWTRMITMDSTGELPDGEARYRLVPLGRGLEAYVARAGRRALLGVAFDARTRPGLVVLYARAAAGEIAAALDPMNARGPWFGAGGQGSAAPAEMALDLRALRRRGLA